MEKQESIRNLKGIGEKTEKLFHILGIDTIQDLLDYYPREYEQYRIPVSVSMVRAGEKIAVLGKNHAKYQLKKYRKADTCDGNAKRSRTGITAYMV